MLANPGQLSEPPSEAPPGRLAPPQQSVESVRRALRILSLFSADASELGVSEIARSLDMHKSTVHRLLFTLELEGFIHQLAGGRYALGWKLFELGEAVRGLQSTREIILRHLEALVNRTSETAHLAVFDEGDVLYVEKVESERPLRMPSSVGKRVPAHCTALGKVFLSGLPNTALMSQVYRPLDRFTPHTITDPQTLQAEVMNVRQRGYAIDHEEIEEGLMCVAAPIVDDAGAVCAAVSIAGPVTRVSKRTDEIVAAVRGTCSQISSALGPKARHLAELATPPQAGRQ